MTKSVYEKEQFVEEGYTVINGAFSQNDLSAFKDTFIAVLTRVLKKAAKKHPDLKNATIGKDGNEGLLALRYTDPYYVSEVQRIISRSPEFFRLSSDPNVFSIIRNCMLLGRQSPLYLLSNGIVFTNPNDTQNKRSSNFELDWHQDTFFTIPKSYYTQFWGPVFQDSTKELGTLQVCPGSHKDGYGQQRIHPNLNFNHRYSMAPGSINKYEPISIELELGQLLIFHGQLIHASGQNKSPNKVRSTILGLCHDASRDECIPVSTHYQYYEKTPERWFYEVYHDENAVSILDEQLAQAVEPVGGI